MERDGKIQSFCAHGDANPRNVKAGMEGSILRQAETRAKARALKDAIGIGDEGEEEISVPVRQAVNGKSKCPHCPVPLDTPALNHHPDCPKRKEAVKVYEPT